MSFFGHRIEYDGWGTASVPTKSAEELRLDEHLPTIPINGTVVDVGAGVGLSLAASIHVRRPDLKIISVDPGFSWMGEEEFASATQEVLGHFEPEQQAMLEADKAWQQTRIEGTGEEIPLEDERADLVVSYAATPEYSYDTELTLEECLRVLKLGGLALHGPMHDWAFRGWDNAIKETVEQGRVSSYISRLETIANAMHTPVDAYFTLLRK